jgi:UDPglucose--hexose-1-phosphate uridylyltransferase
LAVLPARLKGELEEVEKFLLGKTNAVADYHKDWANMLKDRYGAIANETNVEVLVREEVGNKFLRVLEDAGVFKRNEEGLTGFSRFVDVL